MSIAAYIQLIVELSPEFFGAFCSWDASHTLPARPDHWGLYCAGHEL